MDALNDADETPDPNAQSLEAIQDIRSLSNEQLEASIIGGAAELAALQSYQQRLIAARRLHKRRG